MVAPNGARRTRADHPALPLTLADLIATARECREAGAQAIHLHLRDSGARHVLDAGLYREALAEFAASLPGFAVQITTEAAGIYTAAQQRDILLASGARLASVSIREITSDGDMDATRAVFEEARERGIAVQHILYDSSDLALLETVLTRERFADPALQLLFVLGRYHEGRRGEPADLEPFLDRLSRCAIRPDWAACAFGTGETACLVRAHQAGGKLRIGFENSLWHDDGSIAPDNAARVRYLVQALARAHSGHAPAAHVDES